MITWLAHNELFFISSDAGGTMLIKAEGIVIRSQDYGESNKIITLYTRDLGKIGIMARGAKKTKSRLTSVAQLFTYGHYLFFKGSGKGMGTLSQGETIHSFRDLRHDLTKTAYAAYFAELLDKLVEEREPNPFLFQLFLLVLEYLDEGRDADILARLFEIKLLVIGGYKPEVDQCVSCGKAEGHFGFSVKEGGFLCDDCFPLDVNRLSVQPATLKILRLLYHFDIKRLGDIRVKPEIREELQKTLWLFMDYHTPLRLKSRQFLEQMKDFL